MSPRKKVSCVLCRLSVETKITGALSMKGEVSAHQNCLLFSAGIFCKNTPEFDDLFGFSVEDVQQEVKRGRKLLCRTCGERGATAGCGVKRCKKTYHYPCAIEAGAEAVEDEDHGKYELYCNGHRSKSADFSGKQRNRPEDERPSSSEPTTARGDSAAASAYSSDSNLSSSRTRLPSKRRWSDCVEQEELVSKRKNGGCARKIIDDSPNTDEPNTEMEMYAPLESDLDDSAHSIQDDQLMRKNTESPTGVSSENKQQSQDEDERVLHSDAESESLLHPHFCMVPPSPVTKVEHSAPMASGVKYKDKDQVSSIDSVSFWKSCNSAGCTQAIFTDFLHEMTEISRRIQSDQASQKDYDVALKVITDSGKLIQLVAKQKTALQKKKTELKTAVQAMNKVLAELKRQFKP